MRPLALLLCYFVTLLSWLPCHAIGEWKAYLAYSDITEIEKAGEELFVLASKNLYLYNTQDQSVRTFSKMDALSDCGIAHIAWNQKANRLVVIYENENIDLLEPNGNCVNLPEYYMKSVTGDKIINDIYISGQYAYLATGFGILKLDVAKAEISDTYTLGKNITAVAISNGTIYAKTAQGVYSASLNVNLIDPNNWTPATTIPSGIFEKDRTTWNEYIETLRNVSTDGPQYNYFGFMRFAGGRLFTVVGGYGAGIEENRDGAVQVLTYGEWTIYEDQLQTATGYEYKDIMSVDIDPNDASHVFAAGRTGIYEFRDGHFLQAYSSNNSPLGTALSPTQSNQEAYTLVESIKYDAEGNLWMLNSQSATSPIHVLQHDGNWKSYTSSTLMNDGRTMGALQGLTFHSQGLLWFVNNHWTVPSLHCFNPQTEKVQSFTTFINQDGTRVDVNSVQCVAEDKNGDLWVGTNIAPLLLEQAKFNESEPEFIQVKVPRNDGTNYADYLLNGVNISGIAIDGGNRKWFATKGNGAYLISADNLTQLQHFTSQNSMLLSDNIESIAINDQTGEVFFGTDKGLCSYMSDATAVNEEMTKDNVWAYPNPVRPDYTGLITITGLNYDTDVKIVTANGTLVAEGRSNGGTFTWDGCDQHNGKRVASGVYMVLAATAEGNKGTVCKIAIVR